MGRRRYPPLTPTEVISILEALGFTFKRQDGSHKHYELPPDPAKKRPRSVVTVDVSVASFDEFLLKSMIRQSTFGREAFYGATEKTGTKIR